MESIMTIGNKALCRVRTITTFCSLGPDPCSWKGVIDSAAGFCADMAGAFRDEGYTVQSVRVVTNPFGEYLDTSSPEAAKRDLGILAELLEAANGSGLRLRFAIGEARTAAEIALVPELIRSFGDLANVCVNVPVDEFGILDDVRIREAAEAVVEIGRITERGEGNFNFTVNFNCPPLIPYFPAGYHRKELGNRFVIGLETPDLLVAALEACNGRLGYVSHQKRLRACHDAMHEALQYHVDRLAGILNQRNHQGFRFSGFDTSAAPSKDCASMVDVYKGMGVPHFGAAGSVEASALLTRVFKSITGGDAVGFSGLMLALTEDAGLAQGSLRGDFDIRALLTCSAVCGIGLDTVPVPGAVSVDALSALMRDTGTLAFRLNKPLTVRLFPVPGRSAGDLTEFESEDLCNCAVLAVP